MKRPFSLRLGLPPHYYDPCQARTNTLAPSILAYMWCQCVLTTAMEDHIEFDSEGRWRDEILCQHIPSGCRPGAPARPPSMPVYYYTLMSPVRVGSTMFSVTFVPLISPSALVGAETIRGAASDDRRAPDLFTYKRGAERSYYASSDLFHMRADEGTLRAGFLSWRLHRLGARLACFSRFFSDR